MNQQFKSWFNKLKVILTDKKLDRNQKLDRQCKIQINGIKSILATTRSVQMAKDILTDQKLDQQIKNLINRSKVRSTDQNFNQQIKRLVNRSKG